MSKTKTKTKKPASQAALIRSMLSRKCAVSTIVDALIKAYPKSAALRTHGTGYVNFIAKKAKASWNG